MSCIKRRLLIWWSALAILVAALFMPLATTMVTDDSDDAAPSAITMALCGAQGQLISYTITLASDDEAPVSPSPSAYCLSCLLPSMAEAILNTQPLLQGTQLIARSKPQAIPSFVALPTPHDQWLPHRPLAPPILSEHRNIGV